MRKNARPSILNRVTKAITVISSGSLTSELVTKELDGKSRCDEPTSDLHMSTGPFNSPSAILPRNNGVTHRRTTLMPLHRSLRFAACVRGDQSSPLENILEPLAWTTYISEENVLKNKTRLPSGVAIHRSRLRLGLWRMHHATIGRACICVHVNASVVGLGLQTLDGSVNCGSCSANDKEICASEPTTTPAITECPRLALRPTVSNNLASLHRSSLVIASPHNVESSSLNAKRPLTFGPELTDRGSLLSHKPPTQFECLAHISNFGFGIAIDTALQIGTELQCICSSPSLCLFGEAICGAALLANPGFPTTRSYGMNSRIQKTTYTDASLSLRPPSSLHLFTPLHSSSSSLPFPFPPPLLYPLGLIPSNLSSDTF